MAGEVEKLVDQLPMVADELKTRLQLQYTAPTKDGSRCHLVEIHLIDMAEKALRRATEALAAEKARGDKAEADIYQPGVWRCAKCGFRLVQSNLNANSGAVTARNDPGDKCPNDGSPLWRVTWRDDAEAATKWGVEQFDKRVAAEAERDEARAALIDPTAEPHMMAVAEALFDYEPRNSSKRWSEQARDLQYRYTDRAAWVLSQVSKTIGALNPQQPAQEGRDQ